MRINNTYYAQPGDVVMCPTCNARLYKILSPVYPGLRMEDIKLVPLSDLGTDIIGAPMLRCPCGERIIRDDKFASVEVCSGKDICDAATQDWMEPFIPSDMVEL